MTFYREMSYRQRLRMDVLRTALELILIVLGGVSVGMSPNRDSLFSTIGIVMLAFAAFMIVLELKDAIGRIQYRNQQNKKKSEATEQAA